MTRASVPVTALSYALVLVLSVLCTVWGAFLVPLRLGGVITPLSLVFALANAPLAYAGCRVLASRFGGLVPALVSLLLALRFGSSTSHGDLVIPGSAVGYAFLGIGFLASIAGLAAPRATSGR